MCQEHFQVSCNESFLVYVCVVTSCPSTNNACLAKSSANWFKCGLETLLLGGACATVAYTIGQFVDKHVVAA
jgi:hypothetical protein